MKKRGTKSRKRQRRTAGGVTEKEKERAGKMFVGESEGVLSKG